VVLGSGFSIIDLVVISAAVLAAAFVDRILVSGAGQ